MSVIGRGDQAGLIGESAIVYPLSALMPIGLAVPIVGDAIIPVTVTGNILGGVWRHTTTSDLNSFDVSCLLQSGSYTLYLVGVTFSSYGKSDIYYRHEDDTDFTLLAAGDDWYSAGSVVNVVKSHAITISKSGRIVFRVVINGKNASSSSYILSLAYIALRQLVG